MDIETDWLDGSASSLHWAAWIGRVNVVKKLIGKGGDIEVKDDRWGDTPLHEASRNGHLDVVKFLVENKADINAKNKNGKTLLDIAIEYNMTSVADYLRSKGGI